MNSEEEPNTNDNTLPLGSFIYSTTTSVRQHALTGESREYLLYIPSPTTILHNLYYCMHNVRLVHTTPDAEQLIAYMARVSNPNNQDNPNYERLIKYLIEHRHWSPFEMVNMCVEIETTRSVAAQILRHRSFSFQEFSQRYAEVTEPAALPHLRRQDVKNRQNSTDDLPIGTVEDFNVKINSYFELGEALYEEMLLAGVAKECARDVLPLASPTKLYMNGTLRSWLHYTDLRCAKSADGTPTGTQHEHKQIADQVKTLIEQEFPTVYAAMFC